MHYCRQKHTSKHLRSLKPFFLFRYIIKTQGINSTIYASRGSLSWRILLVRRLYGMTVTFGAACSRKWNSSQGTRNSLPKSGKRDAVLRPSCRDRMAIHHPLSRPMAVSQRCRRPSCYCKRLSLHSQERTTLSPWILLEMDYLIRCQALGEQSVTSSEGKLHAT